MRDVEPGTSRFRYETPPTPFDRATDRTNEEVLAAVKARLPALPSQIDPRALHKDAVNAYSCARCRRGAAHYTARISSPEHATPAKGLAP